ncbi:phage-related integrase [Orientia tsutsugamushi str. Boryong]|uniref:Phage-related integrase n=3 Tax=Orientia tsutsugamushi TaxID=784 RepID=A5CCP8_ORITB|nr:phage-related integrase [Orientia tsutsugamushi str. Boryong]CAM79904.1 phage-related integrase [Orientia tsutsugamushi str. Boryong]CAM80008.1 phage-related integrase [Orientia tsutsugamushi str. Boryong]CAM80274.1 phage-related integrase [Orientia tsutsugamushi str. Boryong]CAM80327.1 phage-related integrase [Orientia tsutsugamushi str. Boryong]
MIMTSISSKFINRALRKIKIPKGEKLLIIHDPDIIGLKLKISCTVCGGIVRKTWILEQKYKNQSLKIRIVEFPYLSIKEARKIARELKTLMANGIDPRAVKHQQQIEENENRIKERERKANDITFKELCYKYIEEYAKIYTINWKENADRVHTYAQALYEKKISKIRMSDIEPIFNDISKEGKYATANALLATLRTIFNKAIKWGLIENNPTLGIEQHKLQARERRLSYDEMGRFLQVLCGEASPLIRDFALLALYTGARKSNVLEMEWDNIDFERKIWHIPKTKNGKAQNIPLTDEAMEILQARKLISTSKWVLPSSTSESGHLSHPNTAWKIICEKASIKNFRIHDLRRTFASCMGDAGESQRTISIALNHINPNSTIPYTIACMELVREYMSKAIQIISECARSYNIYNTI